MKNLEMIGKILIGNSMLAICVNMLIIPFHFISGGSTGLALIVQHFLSLDFTLIVSIINLSMFLLGFFVLGKKFAATILLSTFIYPVFVEITKPLIHYQLVQDPLTSAILAGIFFGVGMGLVIQSGASTGGLDVPPIILERKLGWNVSITLNILDLILLSYQMTYSTPQQTICGVIIIFMTAIVMNHVITYGKSSLQLLVISEKYEDIKKMFLYELDKGVTLFTSEGGYSQIENKTILSIISRKDLYTVQRKISEIDPHAFMIVNTVKEVNGLGFKPLCKKIKQNDV